MSSYLATGERAALATTKLQEFVNRGRERAAKVIETAFTQVPTDTIVRNNALQFRPSPTSVEILLPEGRTVGFHRHAIGQAAERSNMPLSYVDTLRTAGPWGRELLAENFNKLFANQEKTRYLVRAIHDEARGFLSDRFRRLDSRPILEALNDSFRTLGVLPYDGYALDTKLSIQAIHPTLYEPIPGEVIAFGCSWQNSDFGDGALEFRSFILRMWCDNGAIGQDTLRQVHLGRRLTENVEFSRHTYELDTRTMTSAIRDVARHTFGPDSVNNYLEAVSKSAGERVEPKQAVELLKKYLNKSEVEKVVEAYNSPDIEMMPAGQSKWRLSQAMSWVANDKAILPERKLEMQRAAGDLLKVA